ncbi:MAG: TonB-dependent receptor [Terrimonas sp.]|nr:TonB-dependent receptor [Terrimonas sp.]
MQLHLLKKLIFAIIVFMVCSPAFSQVTTSGINGTVLDSSGVFLEGATITATHKPSGTVYTTISGKSGFFNIANARVGGPYEVKVEYVGFSPVVLDGITLVLGEPYNVSAVMGVDVKSLSTLVITGNRRRNAIEKTGASSNLNSQQLAQLPTINRSITDFTRLAPQSNGNSFAGRDGRYNNVQVDGANFNNGFGLNDNPLPGGGGLSLDAIEEIQVNIAPYDVRQGGFTGAGINAVTRSGTNTFSGSAYYYFRHQGITGHKVNGEEITNPKSASETKGFRLGGPIIKNKLFFFVNAEHIDNSGALGGAINLWKPSENGVADPDNDIARTKRSDLEAVRNHLINQWGYDPGRYEGYADNTKNKTRSYLARIDWNISKNHKLAIRYNQVESDYPELVNGSSGPQPRSTSANRVSAQSMAFEKTMYFTASKVNSVTLELNSKLSSKLSNQFLATYSKIFTGRTSNSEEFPMIDIGDGAGTSSTYVNYISAGYELFTYANEVKNDNYNFFNNLSYVTNKHNFTFGASFELQKFANGYTRMGTSYYRYASVADFLKTGTADEVAPIQFGLTYAYPGQEPYAKVKYGLPAIYVQDKISFTKDFSLTLGLRAEVPWFIDKLPVNAAVDALELQDVNGNPKYYTSKWPKTRLMLSPRVGFRWDIEGDRSLILRGGTGIFSGRVPFVWLTNMPSNLGVIQNTIEPGSYGASAGWIGDIRFNPEKYYWLNNTPASAADVFIKSPQDGVPSSLALVDPDFKMPQIWRSSIGFDKAIPNSSLTLTADFLFTKDIQAVYQFGANRKAATQTMSYSGDNRDFFPNAASYTYNSLLGGNAGSVLTNTNKGYSMNLSVGLSLPVRKGLFGSLFYSTTVAGTTTDNPGSNASSAWGSSPNINTPNDLAVYSATDALPNRIVGNISYRIEYLKHLATTISLYYNGANLGRYSYGYTGDLNGDGISADLLYIPNSADELNFTAITGSTPFTVEQQKAAFDAFIDNDKYLSKMRGKYAERNGALLPWLHRFDFKVLQDIFTNIGKQKNTLQLSLDIINVGNMLNSKWGIQQTLISGANTLLTRRSVTAEGVPTFTMNTVQVGGQTILPTTAFRDVTTTSTTWGMQIGLRYIFN